MKNREIVNLYEGISALKFVEFPIQVTYAFLYNAQALEPYYNTIFKCRENIFKQYGILREDGAYDIPEENREIAQQELDKLANIDNNINLRKVRLSDLPHTNISMVTLQAIMPMISEEE